jgi:hypothetical protein
MLKGFKGLREVKMCKTVDGKWIRAMSRPWS